MFLISPQNASYFKHQVLPKHSKAAGRTQRWLNLLTLPTPIYSEWILLGS